MLDKIKERVSKLLRTASNGAATDGEIDNALRFAKQIMDKYHLSEEDLVSEPTDQYKQIEQARKDRQFVPLGKKVYTWELYLGSFVEKFVGGIGSYYTKQVEIITKNGIAVRGSNGRVLEGKRMYFYGIAEDVQLACEIYDDLRKLIAAMATIRFGGPYKGNGGVYSEGFIIGLSRKLEAQTSQAKIGQDSRGLVLIERRNDLIEHKLDAAKVFLAQSGVNLGGQQSRVGAKGSYNARQAGIQDGMNSDVNGRRKNKLEHYL